jgi:PKHD-type hydroxylase
MILENVSINTQCQIFPNVLSEAECDEIIEYCQNLNMGKGQAVNSSGELSATADTHRISNIAWINEGKWLDKINQIGHEINKATYQYDLYTENQSIQYTEYDASYNGHYDWHVDLQNDQQISDLPYRKLSFSIMLSGDDEFEGGFFQTLSSDNISMNPQMKGAAIVFPSYNWHRVTPVFEGNRKSLVLWLTGPKFK